MDLLNHISRGPIALFLFCGLWTAAAAAGLTSAEIKGFKLDQCGVKNCFSLSAATAYEGQIPGSYASGDSVVKIKDKKTGQELVLESKDVYYDGFSEKLFVRRIKDQPHREIVYDFRRENITYY